MEHDKHSMKIAGIDVGKASLNVAIHGEPDAAAMVNSDAGREELVAWLQARGVDRVGLEPSGGYERAPAEALRAAGFEVVMPQAGEVRAFARMKRLRAKNDALDARLIGAFVAQMETIRPAGDPRLGVLAEWLTAYEQASELAARLKTCREHVADADLKADYDAQISAAVLWKKRLQRELIAKLKAKPDLARRYDLLLSLPGVGPLIAAALVIRMPELGAMQRGQPSSLLGVAPFDHDSGKFKGRRSIRAGRARPRRLLYLAALVAKRICPQLALFAKRLIDQGKPPKVAIVAVMRKLIEAANLVLARQSPWINQPT